MITTSMFNQLWALQSGRCLYCSADLTEEEPTIDHIIPRDRGGSDALDNLCLACKPCNEAKSNLTLQEFMPEIAKDIAEEAARQKQRAERRPARFQPFAGLADALVREGKLPEVKPAPVFNNTSSQAIPEPSSKRRLQTFFVERSGRKVSLKRA